MRLCIRICPDSRPIPRTSAASSLDPSRATATTGRGASRRRSRTSATGRRCGRPAGAAGRPRAANASATSRVSRLPTLRCGVLAPCLPAYGAQSGNAAVTLEISSLNRGAGSGRNHTTLVPKRRTSPNVASNGSRRGSRSARSPPRPPSSTGLRNGNNTVTCDGILRPRLRRWRGAQVVQGVVHVWGKEHEGRAVDAHAPIIVGRGVRGRPQPGPGLIAAVPREHPAR